MTYGQCFCAAYVYARSSQDRPGKMDDIALRASDHVLEVIFSYLDLHTLRNCSLVCKRWYRFLNDENNDVWRMHCIRKLAQEALSSDLLSSVPTYKSKLRAFYHAWNPNDCSRNIYIKPNGFTLHRLVCDDVVPPTRYARRKRRLRLYFFNINIFREQSSLVIMLFSVVKPAVN